MTDPGKKIAEVAQAQSQKLGFKIRFRACLPQDTLYTESSATFPRSGSPICLNVGWFKDFNDPQAVLDAVFNGKNIIPANNSNWTQLNVPAINDAMGKAALLPGPARPKAWGQIDEMTTCSQRGGCGTRSRRSGLTSSAAWSTSTPRAGTWTSPP